MDGKSYKSGVNVGSLCYAVSLFIFVEFLGCLQMQLTQLLLTIVTPSSAVGIRSSCALMLMTVKSRRDVELRFPNFEGEVEVRVLK